METGTTARETVGVALIGSGRMGAFHAETLALRLPHARLVAVVDPAPGAAERLRVRSADVRTPTWRRPGRTRRWTPS